MNLIAIIIISLIALVLLLIIIGIVARRMKGSIEIIPEKYSYSPGETIKGKVELKLKKPIESDSLNIGLIGQMKTKSYSGGKTRNRVENIFNFSQPLESRKNYSPSEYTYNFSIKIPSNVLSQANGTLGAIIKSAQLLTGNISSIKWHLISELKCKGFDISKKIQINIA